MGLAQARPNNNFHFDTTLQNWNFVVYLLLVPVDSVCMQCHTHVYSSLVRNYAWDVVSTSMEWPEPLHVAMYTQPYMYICTQSMISYPCLE